VPRGLTGFRFSLALAGALLALLAVLATLQYRWIGAVSDAERDQRRASAQAAARAVAGDFDREIGHALYTFGGPARDGEPDTARRLAAAFRRWTADSKSPRLVADVYVAHRTGDAATLDRFDRASGSLAPVAWPEDLAGLRQAVESPARRHPPERVFADVPALLIEDRGPEAPPPAPPGAGVGRGLIVRDREVSGSPPDWIVLRLDRKAISDEILPQLVGRHFGESGEYDVAVLSLGERPSIVYRSRVGFDPAATRTEAEAMLLRAGPDPGEPGGPGAPPPQLPEGAPPPPPARAVWRLVAAHRDGSLDSAVAATRARNLAVSGAILLLLAATVAGLLASAHRARLLAEQQVEFVAGLTHELRTPLAAVRSAGQNLADGIVSDGDRVRAYGILIHRESQRLSGLIESALAQAGIAARGEPARREPVHLAELLAEAVEACQPLAEERGVLIETEISSDLPVIAGDRAALRTLFENLVSNAVKYGGRPGRVAVTAARSGADVSVEVRDNGPGIPPGELSRIFEPFYRGRDAKQRASGSGLGLSLVRRIAEEHGGQVTVESPAGAGAAFRVALPGTAEPA